MTTLGATHGPIDHRPTHRRRQSASTDPARHAVTSDDDEHVRAYVSRLWTQDWGSADDAVYDTETRRETMNLKDYERATLELITTIKVAEQHGQPVDTYRATLAELEQGYGELAALVAEFASALIPTLAMLRCSLPTDCRQEFLAEEVLVRLRGQGWTVTPPTSLDE